MLKKIIIATRVSQLALWQSNYIKNKILKKYPHLEINLLKIVSEGDKILDKPLSEIGGKGHFTKALEDQLLLDNADIAVHSLKDIPTYMPNGLELFATTKREEQNDIFLSNKFKKLIDLPINSIVGTTSLRRKMQLLKIRPDLKIKNLRGNINTRLNKLKNSEYDAIILAYIGIKRLELIDSINFFEKLPLNKFIPPMGQASLGIQVKILNQEVKDIISFLNDKDTFFNTKLEREFISKIGANCSSPVAVNSNIKFNKVTIEAMIGNSKGDNSISESISSEINYSNLGIKLAEKMINKGALDLLSNISREKNKNINRL